MSLPAESQSHITDEELHEVLLSRKNRPRRTDMVAYDGQGNFFTTTPHSNNSRVKGCINQMSQHLRREEMRGRLQRKLAQKAK